MDDALLRQRREVDRMTCNGECPACCSLSSAKVRRDPRVRFETKFLKMASCWVWTAQIDASGYGHFWLHGETVRAHRAAWVFYRGPIPVEAHVLHSCDNPCCVNPDHLFLGGDSENMTDCASKGRLPKSKLVAWQVRAIRRSEKPCSFWADRYGVHETTVLRARKGELYQWVK